MFKKIIIFSILVTTCFVDAKETMQNFFDSNYNKISAVVFKKVPFDTLKLDLDEFIQQGGDINEFFIHSSEPEDTLTLLMYAAFNGSVKFVQYLLTNGANPLLKNNKENNVFYFMNLSLYSRFSIVAIEDAEIIVNQVKIFELLLDTISIQEHKNIFKDWVIAIKDMNLSELYSSKFNNDSSDDGDDDSFYDDIFDDKIESFSEEDRKELFIMYLEKGRNKKELKWLINNVIKKLEALSGEQLMKLDKDRFIIVLKEIFSIHPEYIEESSQILIEVEEIHHYDYHYLYTNNKYLLLQVSVFVDFVIPFILKTQPESLLKTFNYFVQSLDESEKSIVYSNLAHYLKTVADDITKTTSQDDDETENEQEADDMTLRSIEAINNLLSKLN